jgi:aspartyl-tRNA(Asn)/glutamyl-tRNA(Gln) amidotransferase subunit C
MDHAGITRLAALAKLDITDAERETFANQITDILTYVDQIQAVDTSGVTDTSHPLPMDAAWREDVPVPSLTTEAGLANAPDADHSAGLFRVPKVIG